MSYISTSDITNKLCDGFELEPYIQESDQALEDLAQTLGADAADIDTTPLHFKLRRYAIVYVIMRLCQDKAGGASVEIPEANKYLIGYEMHRKELDALTKQINYEMVTGNVNAVRDRVASVSVWRG